MKHHYILVPLSILAGMGCSARPITSASLKPTYQEPSIQPISGRTVASAFSKEQLDELRQLNQKAKTPRFAIVKGFYQLPTAFAAGAVRAESFHNFAGRYQSIELYHLNTRPYAIVPLSPKQSEILSQTLKVLLGAGIQFADIKMADAVQIIAAEKKALEKQAPIFPAQMLPSGVELLMSIEMGEGETGPVYFGRVIRSTDGELLALAFEPNYGVYAIAPLITKLVQDALTNLANR